MKAITLTQPWATLVAIGAKKIETRSWFTRYRGPLAIHAAKGFPREARRFTAEPVCYEAVARAIRLQTFPAYPLGYVVATCQLACCARTEEVVDPHGPWWPSFTDQERAFGNYSPGRYAWILEDVERLWVPIPVKGALGLWEWNEVIRCR